MYKIQVGISACLLGQTVRFDGGHKRSAFCTDTLANYFDYLPVCPEMAIGLGSPRPALRLVRQGNEIRMQASNGQFDVTDQMIAYSQRKVSELGAISGYILCAKSPSCGMERVRLYSSQGAAKEGTGLFAHALMTALPLLPVEEEGRLNDPVLRENFVTRVFAYHDWQQLLAQGLTAARLIAFHSRYKYLVMAHRPTAYRALGRLLAALKGPSLSQVAERYITQLMQALRQPANRKGHTNVLQHLQGYFKRQLSAAQREELAQLIQRYRTGELPLLAPMTLLQHYLREHPNDYLGRQVYLSPHPAALGLRYSL